MTVEQMCCTREQSIRLRELGIDQKSYFYHTIVHVTHLPYVPIGEIWDRDLIGSAWTVGELMKLLDMYSFSKKDSEGAMCGYAYDLEKPFTGLLNSFPAQGLCGLLIYLLSNALLTIEEVNKRLHE